MRALAFDTSTDACSVAVRIDDEVLEDHRVERQAHARLLLPMIEALLARAGIGVADLDAIAFGRGPGGFTGVRIATAAAQGLAFAADVGVVGVSTLAAIGQGCLRIHGDRDVLVAMDARMDELYVARCRANADDVVTIDGGESVCAPGDAGIDSVPAGVAFAGSGIGRHPAAFASARGRGAAMHGDALPYARDLLALAAGRIARGELDDAADAIPTYLRDRVAFTESERAARRP